ncbi:PD-(D/E)XK nuclease-like domain-containing protein [Candidatus Pacearchaeota archaeon]|jgi:hypothetical protein|nr:PD-(D/E)XK nuclease-like domain-containing protein [Candidatus Pacearchaeota archaeon]
MGSERSPLDEAIHDAETADPLTVFAEAAPEHPVAAWPDGLPAPGIYNGVSYEVYRAWPAVNASALKILAHVTPKHCKSYIDGKLDTDSPDRLKGRAFHAALLEPDTFTERFPVGGICAEPLASGKRKGEPCGNQGTHVETDTGLWFCGVHGKAHPTAKELPEMLTADQHAAILDMRNGVFSHRVVALLRRFGGCEVSAVWERDGIPCKARFDKLIIDQPCPTTICDLKKIQPMAGTVEALVRAIRSYGYDLAAWWYRDGLARLRPDKKPPLFAWIFAEDSEPFDVSPKWASAKMLEIGRIKAEKAFAIYKWCAESCQWPGYCTDIEEIDPDDYELKRYGLAQ